MKQRSEISIAQPEKPRMSSRAQVGMEVQAGNGRPLYDEILVRLRKKVSLFVLRGFFRPMAPFSFEDGLLTLVAPSEFHRDWIRDHYAGEIVEVAASILNEPVAVHVLHDDKLYAKYFTAPEEPEADDFGHRPPQPKKAAKITPLIAAGSPGGTAGRTDGKGAPSSLLSAKYTFEKFVRGPSNEMAFASCLAVAEEPGMRYSPLFLFGPTGVGKTHLLQAIGRSAKERDPGLRVVYMSAEQWVNEYIHDIRNKRFDEFRQRYRSGCELLLIDDIQFLAGKDASQDEFFHTFNSLHASHRQIVVTSDRYPHEISGLAERLQTRLGWGLIADIKPPEMETRVAILQQKAEESGRMLPVDVAHYLADHIRSSVRALEGALVRLIAYANVTGEAITLHRAKEYLRPVLSGKQDLSLDKIQEVVSNYYDLRVSEVLGKSRQRRVTLARQISMYLARKHLQSSLPEIGRSFGRDHTTVLSSVRKIAGLVATDSGTKAVINRLEEELK